MTSIKSLHIIIKSIFSRIIKRCLSASMAESAFHPNTRDESSATTAPPARDLESLNVASQTAQDHQRPRKRTLSQTRLEGQPEALPAAIDSQHHSSQHLSGYSRSSPPRKPPSTTARKSRNKRCHLLGLPAELREAIWSYAVVEWGPPTFSELPGVLTKVLHRRPIRMDRFNRPEPPAITISCHQLRSETLHLYYELNEFECWRPLFWLKDWSQSTFIDWISSLSPKQRKWLRSIVLLYKHESELEYNIEMALAEEGFHLQEGIIRSKQELSEYEMCFDQLGLPRHFGKKRRWDRWMAGSAT